MAEACAEGRHRLLKRDDVALRPEAARIPAPGLPRPSPAAPPQQDAPGEPEVSIVKADDGTVQRITVRCPCGREMTLECEYFAQGEDDESKDA